MSLEIIFYDGNCNFCSFWVRFVLKRDRGRQFRFSTLGGKTFRKLVLKELCDMPQSTLVVLTKNNKLKVRSSAVVYILRSLGGAWSVLGWMLWVIPKPIRDLGYSLVARFRNRFSRWIGVCPLNEDAANQSGLFLE